MSIENRDQNFYMTLIGVAMNAHERFPINFDYKDGRAFFNGCKVEATVALGNGKTIVKRIDIRAFGEVAEEMALVNEGSFVVLKGELGQQKGNDNVWRDIVTITEVVSVE